MTDHCATECSIMLVTVAASEVIGHVLTTAQFANYVIKRVYILGCPDGDEKKMKRAE